MESQIQLIVKLLKNKNKKDHQQEINAENSYNLIN